jgi:hypothetical protein
MCCDEALWIRPPYGGDHQGTAVNRVGPRPLSKTENVLNSPSNIILCHMELVVVWLVGWFVRSFVRWGRAFSEFTVRMNRKCPSFWHNIFKLIIIVTVIVIIIVVVIVFAIIIINLVITFTHGIYNYIPETNRVSKVYSVAAVLWLQYMLHVLLFPMFSFMHCTVHQHFSQFVCRAQYGCFM